MSTLRILIADDHPVMRRSIRTVVEAHPQWTVCSEAENGKEAVEQSKRLHPDIALLDLSMPELNGLEAARRITRDAPHTRVFIMTVHETEGLADEARRSGAEGVIAKAQAHYALPGKIESHSFDAPVHLAGTAIGRARHIAAFFHSPADRYRVLAPFVEEGLRRGEKALHIIDPPGYDLHLRRLREAGADVRDAEASGQIEFASWHDTYLRDGAFDMMRMTQLIRQMLAGGRSHPGAMRLVAFMEWALEGAPGAHDLIEYEHRLNYVIPNTDDVVICAYDLSKFDGHVIAEMLRSHAGVVIGDRFAVNPFYVHPSHAGYAA